MNASPVSSHTLSSLQSASPADRVGNNSLSVEETAAAIEILRTQRQLGDRYAVVTVVPNQTPTRRAEPNTNGATEVQEDREVFAVVVDREAELTYEAIVSLSTEQLLSWQPVLDVQPREVVAPPPPPPPLPPASSPDNVSEGGLHFGNLGAVLRRQAWIAIGITIACAVAAVAKSRTDVPIYSAEFELLTEPATAETQVISTTLPNSPEQTGGIAEVAEETKLKILRSPQLLQPIVEEFQGRYPDVTYDDFEQLLRVSSLGGDTQVLKVSFRHPDPEVVSYALDLTSNAYIQFSVDDRQTGIELGMAFVEKQLPELRERSRTLQDRLQALRRQYTTLDPESTGDRLSAQLGSFQTQRRETRVELDELKAVRDDLQASVAAQQIETASLAVLNDSPRYQSLLERLLQVDSQIATESGRFKPGAIGLDPLQRERASLVSMLERERVRMLDEINSRIRTLEARDRSLSQTIGSIETETIDLTGLAREYSEIQRELNIVRGTLNNFETRREELRVNAAQQEVPWTILTPAAEPTTDSSSLARNLVLGTLLGLLVGVGTAIVNDRLKDGLYSTRDVKQLTRLSLLGIIPQYRALRRHTLSSIAQLAGETGTNLAEKPSYGLSPFHESFRSLYANIRVLRGSARPVRSLVVSSAIEGEGKTTVAMHLAQAAAAIGHRVLLVDADLRRSFALARSPLPQGLSDVLDADKDVRDLIRPSKVDRRLFVLTAGEQFVDPLQLFAAPECHRVMKRLHASFDFVIYDAPPLLGLADAQMLAAETDGLLMVTEIGRLKQEQLKEALEELELFRTKALGIVANRSRKPKAAAYYASPSVGQKMLSSANNSRNGRALNLPASR